MNKIHISIIFAVLLLGNKIEAQNSNYILATSQLGFKPGSPKTLTLVPPDGQNLPDSVPYFITSAGSHIKRIIKKPILWENSPASYPYNNSKGKYEDVNKIVKSQYRYKGWLIKKTSKWGTVWQSDFTKFSETGQFQIETEVQFSLPFSVERNPYERFVRGYLNYLYCQRSGFYVPGIRDAEHLDDAVLDNKSEYLSASGGWYNAGDYRKWMSLTQFNLEALFNIYTYGPKEFQNQVLEEISWGNKYFHAMITNEGQVYEDVGGGNVKGGFKYEEGWWVENHPGCVANNAGNILTDNKPGTGDERKVRTSYNPFVQLAFVRTQALISRIMPDADRIKCLFLAEKAWKYEHQRKHDERTLFVAEELAAGLELFNAGSSVIKKEEIRSLTELLLSRQDNGKEGLNGYFLEKDEADAYRSIAFSCQPPLALLRYFELQPLSDETLLEKVQTSITRYIDHYLLPDSKSNAFRLTPYGAYIKMPHANDQTFRDAGRGRGVRTFIHPYNEQFIVHGTNSVVMNQAYLLAKAGKLTTNKLWQDAAECLLQWATGHNPAGLSLFIGIGYTHPILFSMENLKISDAAVNGFTGNPDDTPYIETSNVMNWNTQEIWDIPYMYAVGAVSFLK